MFAKKLFAEALGTFGLVFAGTAAIVVDDLHGGVTHLGVALVFGLVVFALIAALGDVSGAHLNPAVTLGLFAAGRVPRTTVLPYVACQCLGAVAASLAVRGLFPGHAGLGATVPSGSWQQSWFLEFLLTGALMLTILSVTHGGGTKSITVGLAIGSVVGLEALFAGPVCGASMNPARSLAPALVSCQLGALWVYLTAPMAGAAIAVPACRCLREAGCCGPMTISGADS